MDLVVGAPHFFERKEEIGGAVYVYINPGGHWDSATPLRLNGTCGSMFGIALSAAGDLNHDGFEGEGLGALGRGPCGLGHSPHPAEGGDGRTRGLHLIEGPGRWSGLPPHTHLLLSPPDLAVGAPFDGAGKVYVYHGSSLGIVVKPAQVRGDGVGGGIVHHTHLLTASRCHRPVPRSWTGRAWG